MMLIKTSLKPSSIQGLGCFTEEDLKKGQIIWKLDPVVDIEIKESELKNYPKAFVDFLKIYAYVPLIGPTDTLILCGDHARHMNHSSTPNVLEGGDLGELNIAARDIKAGEELTCDYTQFDRDSAHKLNF